MELLSLLNFIKSIASFDDRWQARKKECLANKLAARHMGGTASPSINLTSTTPDPAGVRGWQRSSAVGWCIRSGEVRL
jgi:hypothetical protein